MAFETQNNQITRNEVIEQATQMAERYGYKRFIVVVNNQEYHDESEMPASFPANASISVKEYLKAG